MARAPELSASAAVAVDDGYAIAAMRALAFPATGDPAIVAGETGGTGLAALQAAADDPAIRATLGLDAASRVLLLGSEGDTDARIYLEVIGRTAEEVLDEG